MLCCAGASVASFLFDKGSVSLGASGAVFGLYAVAVLLKLNFSFQKLVRPYILCDHFLEHATHESTC